MSVRQPKIIQRLLFSIIYKLFLSCIFFLTMGIGRTQGSVSHVDSKNICFVFFSSSAARSQSKQTKRKLKKNLKIK